MILLLLFINDIVAIVFGFGFWMCVHCVCGWCDVMKREKSVPVYSRSLFFLTGEKMENILEVQDLLLPSVK